MSDVKRYDPMGYDGLSAFMQECKLGIGEYVASEDYDAMAAENERLRAQVAERDAAIEEWSGTAVQNGMEVDRLNARIAELERDAARYRYASKKESAGAVDICITRVEWFGNGEATYTILTEERAHSAIDAALSAQGSDPECRPSWLDGGEEALAMAKEDEAYAASRTNTARQEE
ncbi:hypothetical protein [Pseudomonas indica]|uniref:hypothetical protein n=1 Tax=Pseudomonas indica TaxID=137658 RepID=UPI003FD3C3FB